MNKIIYKSINEESLSNKLPWEEKWFSHDKGLIACWEQGKKIALSNDKLVHKVKNNELPILPWKGGFESELKSKKPKYAPHYYLAMWQGIKGDDLNIDINSDKSITCSKTGMTSIFTFNHKLYEDR